MSILVLGASHRSASIDLLERLALDAEEMSKLRAAALDTPHVLEAVVLATCNRVEIYAKVDRFHGGVEDLTALLVDRAGPAGRAEHLSGPVGLVRGQHGLVPGAVAPNGPGSDALDVMASLYVHYDAGAVAHLFSVAAGLESMVVGEGQILGQVRDALRIAQEEETVGAALNALFQHALRVGKRAHRETGIDRAGRSLVSVALDQAAAVVGDISKTKICIVGAGSVAALAAAAVRRAGAREVVVLSRTFDHAGRVADGVAGRASRLSELGTELEDADVLICCTGARGVVVPADTVVAAMAHRDDEGPLAIVDLALPHDVDPMVARIPAVSLIGLQDLAGSVAHGPVAVDIAAVEAIVSAEVDAFASARDVDRVAPTVVALRAMATGVIATELSRLFARLPELTERQRAEIEQTLRREADKLLHEPTVRVKQFAGRVPESSYAAALAELFALDPATVDAVSGNRTGS